MPSLENWGSVYYLILYSESYIIMVEGIIYNGYIITDISLVLLCASLLRTLHDSSMRLYLMKLRIMSLTLYIHTPAGIYYLRGLIH